VKVSTPLGSYPLELRGLERREDGVAIVGLVAGLKADLVLERRELLALGAAAALLAAAAASGYLRRAAR
jgi:hypothetical protein